MSIYLFKKIQLSTDVITIPSQSTSPFQLSISDMMAKIYNQISDYLKTKSLFEFHREVKKKLFANELTLH